MSRASASATKITRRPPLGIVMRRVLVSHARSCGWSDPAVHAKTPRPAARSSEYSRGSVHCSRVCPARQRRPAFGRQGDLTCDFRLAHGEACDYHLAPGEATVPYGRKHPAAPPRGLWPSAPAPSTAALLAVCARRCRNFLIPRVPGQPCLCDRLPQALVHSE